MKCLRCNYEWDVREGPCPRCRLRIRAPGQSGATNRPAREPLFDNAVSSPSSGIREPLFDNVVAPAASGDRTAQVQSNHQLDLVSEKPAQLQFPMHLSELRPSRFPATDSLDPKRTISPLQDVTYLSNIQKAPASGGLFPTGGQDDMHRLTSGTLLHRDRYGLQRVLHRQEWSLGIVETMWSALDTRITTSPVIIHELSVPDAAPREAQDIPYAATKVFTSIGRNPHILVLRDVFSDKGRNFFVFEPVAGVSLATLMSNSGGKLAEQEAIICCLQLVKLLDLCSQQVPPLIHGNIRPEYVLRKPAASHYVLTNFSVALAGGLAQIVADTKDAPSSPFNNIESIKGKMDGRVDLSALLALAYHAITGHRLSAINMRLSSADLSPRLHAIFVKGLLAPLHQRYQTPSELYLDLLALRNEYESMAHSPVVHPAMVEVRTQSSTPMVQTVQQERQPENLAMPVQPTRVDYLEQALLVPSPEELPPLKDANDALNASLWFVGMFLCFILLLLGRGLV